MLGGEVIRDLQGLQSSHPDSLEAIWDLSTAYRLLATMTEGRARNDALLASAEAWHAWPATSYTTREEQQDRAAANQ